MYSGGLRVSEWYICTMTIYPEAISLFIYAIPKTEEIRYAILADRTLDLLTEYWFQCGKPRSILFPSQWTHNYLDISSVNQFLKTKCKKGWHYETFFFSYF